MNMKRERLRGNLQVTEEKRKGERTKLGGRVVIVCVNGKVNARVGA
jgi:hypothetical protein